MAPKTHYYALAPKTHYYALGHPATTAAFSLIAVILIAAFAVTMLLAARDLSGAAG